MFAGSQVSATTALAVRPTAAPAAVLSQVGTHTSHASVRSAVAHVRQSRYEGAQARMQRRGIAGRNMLVHKAIARHTGYGPKHILFGGGDVYRTSDGDRRLAGYHRKTLPDAVSFDAMELAIAAGEEGSLTVVERDPLAREAVTGALSGVVLVTKDQFVDPLLMGDGIEADGNSVLDMIEPWYAYVLGLSSRAGGRETTLYRPSLVSLRFGGELPDNIEALQLGYSDDDDDDEFALPAGVRDVDEIYLLGPDRFDEIEIGKVFSVSEDVAERVTLVDEEFATTHIFDDVGGESGRPYDVVWLGGLYAEYAARFDGMAQPLMWAAIVRSVSALSLPGEGREKGGLLVIDRFDLSPPEEDSHMAGQLPEILVHAGMRVLEDIENPLFPGERMIVAERVASSDWLDERLGDVNRAFDDVHSVPR